MTAEVAILNRHAVALAADSAVTVGGPYGPKVYNTVNKLFALSKFHPVGIMVYSSAYIMGVPIETAIKHFRQHELGRDEVSKLSEYAQRFRLFLETDLRVFPQEARISCCWEVVRGKFRSLRAHLQREAQNQPGKGTLKKNRNRLIELFHGLLESKDDISSATDEFRGEVASKMSEQAEWVFECLFHSDIPLTETEKAQIKDLMRWFLLKEDSLDDASLPDLVGGETGIVIAGFGSDDFFPRIEAFEFVFSCNGASKYNRRFEDGVDGKCACVVKPFAQVDMVQTFMEGRTPSFDRAVGAAFGEFCNLKAQVIANDSSLSAASKRKAIKDLEGLPREFSEVYHEFIAQWTEERQWGPTIQTMSNLPKEELAVIAEALINLTVHKRRASPRAETVGPPVDVAVISKGDGFVWIKRKHYFESALNPHFLENYFRIGD